MKKNTLLMLVMAISISIVACAGSMKQISRMSQSERVDVFTEVTAKGPVPSGFSDVLIRASIKTPLEGYYPLESRRSAHGKAKYPFLVNIDRQSILWQVDGRKHVLPEYVDGKTSHDPDAGEGMKYVLEKKIRLAAGSHTVFFGLPDEDYSAIADILVKDGGVYLLEFKPVYRYKTSPTRIPTFLKGISKVEVMFNEIAAKDR